MGLLDEKDKLLNKLKTYSSINDESFKSIEEVGSFSSVNNSKEIIPFLLDLLTVLIGSLVLERVIGELFTDFVRDVEPDLKNSLKEQLITFDSSEIMPAGFASGYCISLSDIDPYQKLKVQQSDPISGFQYGTPLEKLIRSAIENPGTEVTDAVVKLNYNESTDEICIKPINSGTTIGTFIDSFVNDLIIIDEKAFIAAILDVLYGLLSFNQDKTRNQILKEERINRTLQKMIDEEESFDITDDELKELEELSRQKSNGLTSVNVGCGFLSSSVTIDQLDDLVNTVTGTTDPLTVGNAFSDTLLGSFNDGNDTNNANENANAIKDGFFKKLINTIKFILVSSITLSPQIRMLFGIIGAMRNNGSHDLGNPEDDLKNNSDFINCLTNDAKSKIHEFVFNIVKREILKLVIPVSKYILKEKINSYIGIIKSLIPFT